MNAINKMDCFDHLRLQVGLAFDYANSEEIFIKSVARTMFEESKKWFLVHVFQVGEVAFENLLPQDESMGYLMNYERFGEGCLSLHAIRGDIEVRNEKEHQVVYLPIYHGHHLQYIFVLYVNKQGPSICDDDRSFFQEVTRFIEKKSKALRKKF
ncbi:hypothetical protein [Texcoconibacillus texcoconensis]|uniref:GAF domain-containing protein n=1 Tax=Texcoconibacillus texcoconensis TaxID=1095777 RepID=A0A840QLI4_9BACI|nr:hypothetical protein [Texcoconibacillus texcoconensis]MBB5172234.1 hypothetical protein [Texcoconibacillus texcoconensis]